MAPGSRDYTIESELYVYVPLVHVRGLWVMLVPASPSVTRMDMSCAKQVVLVPICICVSRGIFDDTQGFFFSQPEFPKFRRKPNFHYLP
jgi:hypothetical protein